jgi:hypothetical protein
VKVRALRGVCIGVELHLQPGDDADLPAAEVPFLVSIGAVEALETPDQAKGRPAVAKSTKLPKAKAGAAPSPESSK